MLKRMVHGEGYQSDISLVIALSLSQYEGKGRRNCIDDACSIAE